ncbi:MAG: CBS domain-containing protein [Neisseriaceae bacterium]|nr:CBS domain-containing protein [Neisseriaceae bacterium]
MNENTDKPSFLERLFHRVTSDAPESIEEITRLLQSAKNASVISADTAELLNKVVAFADLEVRDVMIPRAQMNVLKIDDSPKKIMDYAVDTAHSRFPVIEGDRDEVLGILHTKDLLRYFYHPDDLEIKSLLREPVFVPESKSLHLMLREFREKHFHLAMVVDEYGGISGLVTFEDVLEAILGDIEDEFDNENEDEQSIVPIGHERYRVNATTEIETINEFFGTHLVSEDVNTIGGLIAETLERLPEKGEKIEMDGLQLTVARVDQRRAHILIIQKIKTAE